MTRNRTLTLGCLVLLAAMTLGAQGAAAHTDATSKLLLPYFEVELSGTTATTIFSVTNASPEAVPVKISVYSNWGIEIESASITIDGHAVYTADLKAWIVNGQLPGKTLDAAEIAHCQAALSGQRSPRDDLYYSSEVRPGFAVGYVMVQAKGHGIADEFLFGEYFVLDPSQDFAQGDFLIDLDTPTACDHLCDRHGVRFLAGGGFDSGTEVVVWTEHPTFPRGPSASAYFPDEERTAADALAYRQNGEEIDHMGLGLLPLEVVKVSELGLSAPFGWIDLLTDRPTLIALRLSAANRYSVGFQTSCLPLPPGDPPDDPESATLTLIKHVINDDGGVLQVADFPLFIDGQQVASGVAETLDPGTYTASEQNQAGYQAGTWGGDCAADGTVTLAAGDDKVCEITNDDTPIGPGPPTLTLIKHVINDDGGTLQVADFPLFISGQQVASGVAEQLDPGTYTASEQNQPGYTAGTWGGDCAADGTVTLAAGDEKVCEITNDDDPSEPPPATLTLIKHVINDDGGTLQVADFPLFISGQQVASGVAEQLDPGTYTASEQNQAGYQAGTWGGDCAADGTVTLAAGDDKVCEITNDDTPIGPGPPTLTLIKHVINDDGGTLQVADFPLFISGQQVASGVAEQLDPGTYTASEQNQPGYTAGTWGGDCAADGTVTLAAGDDKVCEITNDDDPSEPPPPVDEGCTPGYWKNHTDSWPPTGYSPGQSVASVFGQASAYPEVASASLLEALDFKGGSGLEGAARNLMRAAVAGLLDASHPDVNYPRSASSVISSVNSALASGDRDTMLGVAASIDRDNNLGCPLN